MCKNAFFFGGGGEDMLKWEGMSGISGRCESGNMGEEGVSGYDHRSSCI